MQQPAAEPPLPGPHPPSYGGPGRPGLRHPPGAAAGRLAVCAGLYRRVHPDPGRTDHPRRRAVAGGRFPPRLEQRGGHRLSRCAHRAGRAVRPGIRLLPRRAQHLGLRRRGPPGAGLLGRHRGRRPVSGPGRGALRRAPAPDGGLSPAPGGPGRPGGGGPDHGGPPLHPGGGGQRHHRGQCGQRDGL